MNAYELIHIQHGKRSTISVVAGDPFKAICIGLRMLAGSDAGLRLTCRPARKA